MAFDGTLKFDTSIDQTGFDSGLSGLGSMAEKALSAVSELAKSAASEMWSLGQQAVETGNRFTSSMSQVGATLGYSVAELNNPVSEAAQNMELLTAKAKEMGAATAFSASQAADGLNILAMSGYSAQESVDMINSVLNAAAAGGLSLDAAASYIAGSMKGFTKEAANFADNAEASAYYADMIAKGATLANTNVQQLGEALSQASSTANTYGQSARSTETALLRLAEQNEVGSAAATALAAAMKNLYSPTDQAKQALDALGVSAYDSQGKARDFNTVVDDLKNALYQIDDESARNNLENVIFGIQGQAAFDKMISSSADKVQSFYDSLDYTESGAKGSAALQAETMLDNLSGDITILQSALEGFQISLSENFDAPLREIVQKATGYVSDLTGILDEEGLSGLAASLGEKAAEAVEFISGYIPEMAEAGNEIARSFADGLTKNLGSISGNLSRALITAANGTARIIPAFSTAGIRLISALAGSFASALPELMKSAVSGVKDIASGIADNLPDMAVAGLTILDNLVSGIADNLPELIRAGEEILSRLADDMQKKAPRFRRLGKEILKSVTKSVSENIPLLTESVLKLIDFTVRMLTEPGNLSGLVDAAVSILLALADGLIQSVPVLIAKVPEIISHLGEGITKNAGLIEDSGKKILEQLGESLINAKDTLKDKAPEIMQNVLDALKNVTLAAGSVADAVISAIADALGIGDKWNAVKEKVSEEFQKIDFDELKLKLKTEFEILTEKAEAVRQKISEALGEIDFEELKLTLKTDFEVLVENAEAIRQKISEALGEIDFEELKQELSLNLELTFSDIPEEVKNNVNVFLSTLSESSDRVKTSFDNLKTSLGELKESFQPLLDSLHLPEEAKDFLKDGGLGKLANAKLKGDITAPFAVFTIAIDAISRLISAFVRLQSRIVLFASCVTDEFAKAQEGFETLGENIYDFIEGAKQWGRDLIDNFISGVTEKWNDWESTWEDVGGVIYDLLHHTHPDKGLLKDDNTWMPDMMLSFAEGIRSNIPLVTNEAEKLTDSLKSTFENSVSVGVNLEEPELFTMPELPEISAPELKIEIQDIPEIPEIRTFRNEIIEKTELIQELPEIENPEITFSTSEFPEIENPEITFIMPELPEIENPEIIFDMPDIPEMEISLQEIDPSAFSDLEILPPDVPEITVQTDDFPDFPNPEKTPPPPPDFPQMPSVSLPEPEVSAPEFRLPDWNLPKLSPEVVQAFRMQGARMPEFLTSTNQTAEIINQQYSYHTVNQNTQEQNPAVIELTLHSNVELDRQAIGNAVEKFIIDTNAEYGGAFI